MNPICYIDNAGRLSVYYPETYLQSQAVYQFLQAYTKATPLTGFELDGFSLRCSVAAFGHDLESKPVMLARIIEMRCGTCGPRSVEPKDEYDPASYSGWFRQWLAKKGLAKHQRDFSCSSFDDHAPSFAELLACFKPHQAMHEPIRVSGSSAIKPHELVQGITRAIARQQISLREMVGINALLDNNIKVAPKPNLEAKAAYSNMPVEDVEPRKASRKRPRLPN